MNVVFKTEFSKITLLSFKISNHTGIFTIESCNKLDESSNNECHGLAILINSTEKACDDCHAVLLPLFWLIIDIYIPPRISKLLKY